jgi:hypothetical protein
MLGARKPLPHRSPLRMNKSTAWLFMVAARDDPVLASWAAVCHGHPAVSMSEVSPYDAVDAYQTLFNHGIVSSAEYDNTDLKKTFFLGHPTMADVQHVLDQVRILCPGREPVEFETENNMSNEGSFFQKNNALAPRKSNGSNGGISAPRRHDPLGDAFSPKREVIPQGRGDSLGLEAFAKATPSQIDRGMGGLACQDPNENKSDRITVGSSSYQPDVFCGRCGERVHMTDAGAQILPEDGDPSTGGTLLVAVFEGKCHNCSLVIHQSVAEDSVPHERF